MVGAVATTVDALALGVTACMEDVLGNTADGIAALGVPLLAVVLGLEPVATFGTEFPAAVVVDVVLVPPKPPLKRKRPNAQTD